MRRGNRMDKRYSFIILTLFALVMAIVYLANYVTAGLDNGDAFTDKWYYLVGGILYLVAALSMFMFNKKLGWYAYMIALIMTILIALFVNLNLESLPVIVMAAFLILFLLDDNVKKVFDVEFSVKVKL